MNRNQFDRYLKVFNARNYSDVKQFWCDNAEIQFAGYTFNGIENLIEFYQFFHHYVNESIQVNVFLSDENSLFISADVRLEGKESLTQEILADKGYENIVGIEKGSIVVIPQFILYDLKGGRFQKVSCSISGNSYPL